MARYAQILLHFLHAVTNDRDRVHVFLFGTRLTNITRQLRHRDAEVAFQMVSHIVPDWSGGTRIGESLDTFVKGRARGGLARGAVVVICSDGLDRGDPEVLADAMERLHRLCYRIVCYALDGEKETVILDSTARAFIAVSGTLSDDGTMRGAGTHAGPMPLLKRIASLIADDQQLAS